MKKKMLSTDMIHPDATENEELMDGSSSEAHHQKEMKTKIYTDVIHPIFRGMRSNGWLIITRTRRRKEHQWHGAMRHQGHRTDINPRKSYLIGRGFCYGGQAEFLLGTKFAQRDGETAVSQRNKGVQHQRLQADATSELEQKSRDNWKSDDIIRRRRATPRGIFQRRDTERIGQRDNQRKPQQEELDSEQQWKGNNGATTTTRGLSHGDNSWTPLKMRSRKTS